MSKKICTECGEEAYAKELCRSHWAKWRYHLNRAQRLAAAKKSRARREAVFTGLEITKTEANRARQIIEDYNLMYQEEMGLATLLKLMLRVCLTDTNSIVQLMTLDAQAERDKKRAG